MSFSTAMLKYLAAAAAAGLAVWPVGVRAAPAWEQWQAVGGVFDLGGPRSDGSLVVAGSGALHTMTVDGAMSSFAGSYHGDPGAEAYLAVSPGLKVGEAGCSFARDDTFALRLHAPIGITRIDPTGADVSSFAAVSIPSLNGIAFDTVGNFANRLLVTGPRNGKTEVDAIDCSGHVQVVTGTAPVVEGGIAVAPQEFGSFGGDLIAPDELSGVIWAIGQDGSARQLAASGLAKGQDTGVESVGFVPAGFANGGYLYYSDRATANNPHPGTDHILRMPSAELVAAGVREGDMLVATEGGASMIDVRCGSSCHVTTVVAAPTIAHGEGHLAFTLNRGRAPSPTASPVLEPPAPAGSVSFGAFIAIAAAVVAGLAGAAVAIGARRRRR
jgi:hypothetical protein